MAFDPIAGARSIDPASPQSVSLVREQLFASNGNPDVMRDQLRETLKNATPAQAAALLGSFAATDLKHAELMNPVSPPNDLVSAKESAALVGAVRALVADGSITSESITKSLAARFEGGQSTRGLSEVVAKLDNTPQGEKIKDAVVRTEVFHSLTAPAVGPERNAMHPDPQAALCAEASLVNASLGKEAAAQTFSSFSEADQAKYVQGALRAEYQGRSGHEGRGGVEQLMTEVATSKHPQNGEMSANMFKAATDYLAVDRTRADKTIALDGNTEPTGLRNALNDVAQTGMHDVIRQGREVNIGTFKPEMFKEIQQYVRASFGDPRDENQAKRMTRVIGEQAGKLLHDAHNGAASEIGAGFTEKDATRLSGQLVGSVMGSQDLMVKEAEKSVASRKESFERVQSLVDAVALGLGPVGKAGVASAEEAAKLLDKFSKGLDIAGKNGPEAQIEALKFGKDSMGAVRNGLNGAVPHDYITDFESGYAYGKDLGAEGPKLSEGQSAMLDQKAKAAGMPMPAETVAWNGNARSGRLIEIDDSTYAMSVGRGSFVIIKADQLPSVDLHAAAETAQLVSVGKNGIETQQPQREVSMTV